ncbi:MAG: aminopeptidase [Sphingomonas bacterium]|uniref:M28 family peptidase n=1 Tax=Sphingomonas bacterium TaxID=1895847 RepID=UPI002612260D|nr:M28 family peptidase [Sphingomonas bacterium]MDB5695050.1 aminopeptidase [Sphingomonas bacterium]
MFRISAALGLALLTGAAVAQRPEPAARVDARMAAPLPADQAAMKAHVLFLASDAMRGREAGSAEYDIAAQYVAAQFYAAGLRPAGDADAAGTGYLQRVPMVSYRVEGPGKFAWKPRNGRAQPLAPGADFIATANAARAETRVSAPVVFVGHGVTAPQYGHDDYKGVDVRGKIVAVVNGAPAGFGGEESAFFARAGTKARTAQARGAVGLITVAARAAPPRPAAAPAAAPGATAAPLAAVQPVVPAPAPVLPRGPARMTWANPDGTGRVDAAGAPMLGSLTALGAAKLFGADYSRITAAAAAGEKARYTAIRPAGVLSVEVNTSFEKVASSNVVGVIPGSDPKVGKEVVVLSAHLDHIGVRTTGEGDRINNGALDNAIGIASLIEEAKRFAASGTPPRRTVMFLAVTAEEKGLVGADYFANHPTVPIGNIVANVNLDMPVLLYRFQDMTVFGAERSTLGPIVRRAAQSAGVDLTPDANPEEAFFVRSDHFRFVEKGVPSVFLWPGQKGDGGAFRNFLKTCYHRPCDELAKQPILWDQGVRFVDVNYRIAREIADGPARPVWNKGDYFGMLFKGPMAK